MNFVRGLLTCKVESKSAVDQPSDHHQRTEQHVYPTEWRRSMAGAVKSVMHEAKSELD